MKDKESHTLFWCHWTRLDWYELQACQHIYLLEFAMFQNDDMVSCWKSWKSFLVFVCDFNISSHEREKKWISCRCRSSCATSQKSCRPALPTLRMAYIVFVSGCSLQTPGSCKDYTSLLLLSSTLRTYDQHRTHSDKHNTVPWPNCDPIFLGFGLLVSIKD